MSQVRRMWIRCPWSMLPRRSASQPTRTRWGPSSCPLGQRVGAPSVLHAGKVAAKSDSGARLSLSRLRSVAKRYLHALTQGARIRTPFACGHCGIRPVPVKAEGDRVAVDPSPGDGRGPPEGDVRQAPEGLPRIISVFTHVRDLSTRIRQ